MTENNSIGLKSIAELMGYKFYIPSYQRGYRWTQGQVTDLLKDINEFKPREIEDTGDSTWYCLQPVVVKQDGDKWNVIDGQQRLTTIYLILHFLNRRYAEEGRSALFELTYQTRPESTEYMREHLGSDVMSRKNIDFYHMTEAYESIRGWFAKQLPTFNYNGFEEKFKSFTQVIWYETFSKDEIAIFTRLNIGKIRLTDAELIKALFLNSSNFGKSKTEKLRLRQIEIASQWDAMEYALQQDAFWYFLTAGAQHMTTRIELIFQLMSERPRDKEGYETFREFHARFKNKTEEQVLEEWQEIRHYFQTLEEWFTDRYYYHIIGFLIATDTDIRDLLSLSNRQPSKQAFRDELKTLVESKVRAKLEDVEYKKGPVRNILLLHNIVTILKNDQTSRFPFDRFKQEKWDIEHISAVAEDAPVTEKHQQDWLFQAAVHLPEGTLKEKAKGYDKDTFKDLYEQIILAFSDIENPNKLANLTLLDANTNRSYGKSVFPVKRGKIIEKDKMGAFIPVSTRNAFMKFYSANVGQMSFWGADDRSAYFADIKEVLAEYLPKSV